MAVTPLLESSSLIPVRRGRILSDGKPHPRKAWAWLERQLLPFGGTTWANELYEGWNFDPETGEQVRDSVAKVLRRRATRTGGSTPRSSPPGACSIRSEVHPPERRRPSGVRGKRA